MANPAAKERVHKFTIYLQRNPALTEEMFHARWSKDHAALLAPFLTQYGILKYSQYHIPSAVRDGLQDLGMKPLGQYDGVAEIWTRNFNSVPLMFRDPEYKAQVSPDDMHLFKPGEDNWAFTYGWEEVFIRDGKIIENSL